MALLPSSRRNFLTQFALAPALAAADSRPNVLFVVSDDLDCRIGCYGDPVAITPNIDRLAARGVRFDRAYCQYPLCNPTRSSVLSGMYPVTTGVLDNNTWLMLEGAQKTLPDYFEQHGYAVHQFGKIFHGANRGFHSGDATPQPKNQSWYTPAERAVQQAQDPSYWSRTHSPYRNLVIPNPGQYAWANVYGALPAGERGPDAPVADRAVEVLKNASGAGKPFFLAVGFVRPHVPLTAPKEFFDLYRTDAMPLPSDFDTEPRAIEGFPPDEFRQNADLFAGRPFTAQEAREAMRAYYACTSYMDAQLGRLLDTLDQTGLSRNTIVVLWGDHGWHLSEKGMWAKGTLFEVSARGPVILSDPRRSSAGKVSPRVIQYLDLYPTLTDLCRLPAAPWLEGTTLAPLLANPSAPWHRPAYTFQTRDWHLGRSVRNERWRYTEWDEGRRGAALFDHQTDPGEMRNLAQLPSHRATVRQMSALLHKGPPLRKPALVR